MKDAFGQRQHTTVVVTKTKVGASDRRRTHAEEKLTEANQDPQDIFNKIKKGKDNNDPQDMIIILSELYPHNYKQRTSTIHQIHFLAGEKLFRSVYKTLYSFYLRIGTHSSRRIQKQVTNNIDHSIQLNIELDRDPFPNCMTCHIPILTPSLMQKKPNFV